MLGAGEERIEGRLLEGGADHGAHLGAFADDVVAADPGGARRGRQQRGEHVDRRRLAGSVGPEEAVDLAGLDAQVDPVHRPRSLLELPDQVRGFDRGVAHQPTNLLNDLRPPGSWGAQKRNSAAMPPARSASSSRRRLAAMISADC